MSADRKKRAPHFDLPAKDDGSATRANNRTQTKNAALADVSPRRTASAETRQPSVDTRCDEQKPSGR